MKLFITSVLSILTIGTAFSQESDRTISGKTLKNSTKPKSEVKITSEGQELAPVDKTEEQSQYPMKVTSGVRKKNTQVPPVKKERTLANIDREIASINSKMEIVVNDPEEDAIAKEQGWYDLMNSRLEKLNKEREEILNSKK